MEFTSKQICVCISLTIFISEFIFFRWVRHNLPKEVHKDPIINQLQQFFENIKTKQITYYVFIYCLILTFCRFYQPVFIILFFIQGISSICDVVLYKKLTKKN